MMTVALETTPSFQAALPEELFEGPYRLGAGLSVNSFDVGLDGRFLMIREDAQASSGVAELIVVQNWFEELTRLVPVP